MDGAKGNIEIILCIYIYTYVRAKKQTNDKIKKNGPGKSISPHTLARKTTGQAQSPALRRLAAWRPRAMLGGRSAGLGEAKGSRVD